MKALLDTSVLIAAMLPDHPAHAAASAWLAAAKQGAIAFIVSAHSLAEVYAVLTRLPRVPRITPTEAYRLIDENVLSCATVVSLSANDYENLIDKLAQEGVSGGAAYDAVIAKAADLAQVDHLVTS